MDPRPSSADASGEQLAEWLDPAAEPPRPSKSADPGRYVSTIPALGWIVVGGSLITLAGGYFLATGGGTNAILWYMVVCATIGMMETLAGTAWGAMIAMTESARCGSLFVVFPPYMFYYAATRWRWMAQPAILFLSGLGLAFGGIFAGQHLLSTG